MVVSELAWQQRYTLIDYPPAGLLSVMIRGFQRQRPAVMGLIIVFGNPALFLMWLSGY